MTQAELITLEELRKNGPSHRPRERAHILLLSHKSHSITELCGLFELHRSSISTTISNWEEKGIAGLFDSSRTGRPLIIRGAAEEEIVSKITDSPRSLKKVIVDIGKSLNTFLSISTIKRYAKKLGFSWKRVRKSLRNKRNQQDFEKAQSEISILLELANEDGIELYYFDESGFNLTPNVPYAWQKKGTTIEIPSSRSKNINVLGFFSSTGKKLVSYCFEDSVNSDVVIGCFDNLLKSITKKTVIVMDNASIHRSEAFKVMIPKWEKKGLYIYFLPPYSPELNKIEILWRFIKYYWLPFSSFSSLQSLRTNLYEILGNIGDKYQITFE